MPRGLPVTVVSSGSHLGRGIAPRQQVSVRGVSETRRAPHGSDLWRNTDRARNEQQAVNRLIAWMDERLDSLGDNVAIHTPPNSDTPPNCQVRIFEAAPGRTVRRM